MVSTSTPKRRKVTLQELTVRARDGTLSDEDVKRCFNVDRQASQPFAPAFRLDERYVELGPDKPSAQDVGAILVMAAKARNGRLSQASGGPATTMAAAASPLKVLAEGDSWFNLPPLIFPEDAIDILRESFAIWNLAIWGDTIENMVAQKQYKQQLESGLYRHFLFSGGGNDVLGAIQTYVKPRKPGDTNPANAPSYVRPEFGDRIAAIIAQYRTIAGQVRSWAPAGTVLYIHGYGYAIPKKNGDYLGTPLAALGFDPVTMKPLAKAIVAHMVDLYNQALRSFAASRANVVYINLRPKILATDWNTDEIHPNRNGAVKIAAAFEAAIDANDPVA